MTNAVIIKSQQKDAGDYNREMSMLNMIFEQVAEQVGAEVSIGRPEEPHKPTMRIQFNNAADVAEFEKFVANATTQKLLPPLTLRRD